MTNPNINSTIHSHDEVAISTINLINERREGKHTGLRTYLGSLDNAMEPIMPGDFGIMYARPGHNKTTRAIQWLDTHDRNHPLDELAVYVTTETLIESAMTYLMSIDTGIERRKIKAGRLNDEEYLKVAGKPGSGAGGYAVRYAGRNIFFVGKSYFCGRDQMPMTPKNIKQAIWEIEDWTGHKVRTVFIDYLNRVDMSEFQGRSDTNTLVYAKVLDYFKTMGQDGGLQQLVLAQAKQALDERNDPVPTEADIEHTNSALEMADFMIGLMRPWKYRDTKTMLEKEKLYHGAFIGRTKGEYSEQVHLQMQLFRVNKQKDGDAPIDHWYWMNPATGRIVHPDPYSTQTT
jgi:replicative DNA helicase